MTFLMNKDSGFVLKIVRQIECKFNCIAYAYVDETAKWWNICCNDYELYMKDEEFKKFRQNWHIISKKRGIKICFCCCNPIESKLHELVNKDNLILDV